jgi:hypothetical protein
MKYMRLVWVQRNTSTTDEIFCIHHILRKNCEYNEAVHQLFIDFKKARVSVGKKVLYNFLIEFGVSMKLVWLIKMCLNGTYSEFLIGKYFSDSFPIQNSLHNEMLYHHCFSTLLSNMALRRSRKTDWDRN